MYKHLALIILMALTLVFPAGARAQPAKVPPLDFSGAYRFAWSGIPFGTLVFSATEIGPRRTARAEMAFTGMIGFLAPHRSITTLEGTAATYGYETFYRSRGAPKHIRLAYRNGRLAEEIVEPPEPPQKRPPVPAEQKERVPDPLGFVFAVREALHAAQEEGRGDFTVRFYDGKRLTDIHFRFLSPQEGENAPPESIAVAARREAVAGFTAKELKRMKGEAEITVFFSRDALIPLKISFPVKFGLLTAALEAAK